MKYVLVEILKRKELFDTDKVVVDRVYICVEEEQQGFIYTDRKFTTKVKIFNTNDEAVEWGNYNLAPTAKRMMSFFKVIEVEEKDIFVTLEG